jgi:hypothetical protein
MIQGHIHHGRVEVSAGIPPEWEGHPVQIIPLTPDDPIPDLEERLKALDAMGPMEWEPGEKELVSKALQELDALGLDEMKRIMGNLP